MPTEDDLRDLFASDAPRGGDALRGVDAGRVIARSRARRRPRQLAAGAVGTLAIVGIAVVGIQSLVPHQDVSTISAAGGAAPTAESDQAFDSKRAPADKINLCTGPIAEPGASFYGLQLTVEFPATAVAGSAPIEGMARLTNTGTEQIIGSTTSSPAITLSQAGVVLWHSNGAASDLAVAVDLAPGQSLEFPASFTPVRCDVQDDVAESFRAGLPPVGPGTYDLSAALDFLPDTSMVQLSTPGLDLVTGPTATINLQ